jgi:RNA-directed DNA polymerase
VRFPWATRLVVLVDAPPRHAWLRRALARRLREEFANLQVKVNDEKTRTVELSKGESFGFLGFEFWRVRSHAGRWMPLRLPQRKKRTQLQRKVKYIFRSYRSRPIGEVIAKINPILRGWGNYFGHGHSIRCFSSVRDWVEKKIRRHLGRARQRQGFGWKRWSRRWIYEDLGLLSEHRVSYSPSPKGAPDR